jgi:hypothetical protein
LKPIARLTVRSAICALIVPAVVLFYRQVMPANSTTVALTFLLAVPIASANWGILVRGSGRGHGNRRIQFLLATWKGLGWSRQADLNR